MESILRDIRYGIRTLAKSPALTFVATLALTLGIGLTTTMFSIVYGVMLKGLPYPDGDRIVEVSRTNVARDERHLDMSMAEYADYRERAQSFSRVAATACCSMNVSGTGLPERYEGAWVTASFFDITRVKPLLGRVILPGEDTPQGERSVVLAYGMWQRRFGGNPAVLGTVIRVNGEPFTVVGVMPEGFSFPGAAHLWLPLQDDPLKGKREEQRGVTMIGVLKPGVTRKHATAEVAVIARDLAQRFKSSNEGITAAVMPFIDAEIGPARALLWAMLGSVFFVLLIACANVTNLLLDRAAHRTKEVGIRSALGASRTAVVRQFLTEALVLSIAGALLGTALAYEGVAVFNRILTSQQDLPSWIDIRVNAPVLIFVVGLAAVATLFSGAIPALQSSRTDINEVLKDESRGSSSLHIGRMSRVLVVFEIALSCGLLVTAGLMIKSVTNLNNSDKGFRTANLLTARVAFQVTYTDTLKQARFYQQLRPRLAALPGVRSVSLQAQLPGVGYDGTRMMVEGVAYAAEADVPSMEWNSVSPGYFETFEIRPLRGRVIAENDRADADPVVVVNQAFADKFFPGADPLAHRIRAGGLTSTGPWMTIVGVVPTTFTGDTEHPRAPMYYAPLSQHHSRFVAIAVATAGPPTSVSSAVREAVQQIDADVPLYQVFTMPEAIARPTWFIRTFGEMFMIFGFIALFLASIGLYAVMSFAVSRRTREMGIRMALGARSGQVVRLIFRQGAWQLGVGITLGLGLAATLAQYTKFILFDVQPRDPQIYGGVVFVLALVGLAACLVPARRATKVDPLVALRAE